MRRRHWAAAVTAAAMGLAGCSVGGTTHQMGDRAIQAVDVAAQSGTFQQPLDAAPSPDGSIVFFTAVGANGPGLFSVPAAGGAVTTVADGAPFVRPSAVAVATDGSRVFTADARVGSLDRAGAILTASAGGAPRGADVLAGTEGRAPRGLDVVRRNGVDIVYFTGIDPATGSSGLFQIPAAGGAVTTVAEGAPFASLDSVVVASTGVAYVTDRGPAPGQGQVFRVEGNNVATVLNGLHVGAPAGITLIQNETTLLVSTEDTKTFSDQLLFVNLLTSATAVATKVIGANSDSAGGLHRASGDASVLAWCDTTGQVYRVKLR